MIKSRCGFTLMELLVVLALIVIMFGLTMPQIRGVLLTDTLKRSARRVVGLTSELRERAVRNQKPYVLSFDPGKRRYWIGFSGMTEEELELALKNAETLPSNVRIEDIWRKNEGKAAAGEIPILFTPKGYASPSAIHLAADDGRQMTIVLSPFLKKARVMDHYVEFEEQ